MEDIRTQLHQVEGKLRDKRQELSRAKSIAEQAKASYAEHQESDGARQAAVAAVEAVKTVQAEIDGLSDENVSLLHRLGDYEASQRGGLPYTATSPVNGFAEAARRLDISSGEMRVDLAGGALLQRPMAAVNAQGFTDSGAATVRIPATAPPQDRRFAYPALRQQPVDPGDLSVSGVTVSFTTAGLSGVSGIERPPTSADPKAELEANVGWESTDVSQFATVLDDIPIALLNAEDQLRRLLETEMRYRIDLAVDQHVVSGIEIGRFQISFAEAVARQRDPGTIRTSFDPGTEEVVTRLIDEVPNGGRVEVIDVIYSPGIAAAASKWIDSLRVALPDVRMQTVEHVVRGSGHPPAHLRFARRGSAAWAQDQPAAQPSSTS